jgi:hypothetical protein
VSTKVLSKEWSGVHPMASMYLRRKRWRENFACLQDIIVMKEELSNSKMEPPRPLHSNFKSSAVQSEHWTLLISWSPHPSPLCIFTVASKNFSPRNVAGLLLWKLTYAFSPELGRGWGRPIYIFWDSTHKRIDPITLSVYLSYHRFLSWRTVPLSRAIRRLPLAPQSDGTSSGGDGAPSPISTFSGGSGHLYTRGMPWGVLQTLRPEPCCRRRRPRFRLPSRRNVPSTGEVAPSIRGTTSLSSL